MKCNEFYEDQCCTSCFKSEGTKILNAPRTHIGPKAQCLLYAKIINRSTGPVLSVMLEMK